MKSAPQPDVIVIGSGAGGSMVSLGLAEAGMRVLVLERGRAFSRAEFFKDEQDEDLRRFRPDPEKHPHTFRRNATQIAERADVGWTASCVGGATVVYGGVSLRAHADDFFLRAKLGDIADASLSDWPITLAELTPFYERAERLLDVSTEVVDGPAGAIIASAALKLGLHAYRTPLAIRSRAQGGRSACNACGFCARGGCPIGAKSSAPEAIWPRALATGRVHIVPEALAHQIVLDEHGRARKVRYHDRAGIAREASAAIVVVACGAVETARLLLLSAEARHPQGLGNASGHLGRHLTFHHIAEVGGILPGALPTHRSAPSLRALDDYYTLPPAAGAPLGGVVLLGDPLGPIGYALAHTRPGPTHAASMRDYPRHVRMFSIGQDLPRQDNDVSLDPDVKDVFGLPVARITHENHPLDRVAAHWVANQMDALLAEARATDRWMDVPENTSGDAHQHGTCRFGDDREHAVLDRDCAVHGVPNLFVADGSFMPTSTGVNPALTIQANALRVAARIHARGIEGRL